MTNFKQEDKVGHPDIYAFEAMMMRAEVLKMPN